jgi:glycosyltransferase involved in cell wall biosynthesis
MPGKKTTDQLLPNRVHGLTGEGQICGDASANLQKRFWSARISWLSIYNWVSMKPELSDCTHHAAHVADIKLVSVVIACYNQAKFLADAIESVLTQTYSRYEIILVDDGSTDHSAKVAGAYPEVTYIYQANQGLAAARNSGWRACRGDFVVFLDADDRLLSNALSVGQSCLQENSACAFVSGHFRYISTDGRFLSEYPQTHVERDHYEALLRGNYIGMHATVMYRRGALEAAGGFNESLAACEDYDLYLRLARNYPLCCHSSVVAEYRQHGTNMSADAALMLQAVIGVLRSQKKHVISEVRLRKAFRMGLRFWITFYRKPLVSQLLDFCRKKDAKNAARAMAVCFRYCFYYLS